MLRLLRQRLAFVLVSVTRTKITMVIYSSLSRAAFVKLLLLPTDPAWVSNGVW